MFERKRDKKSVQSEKKNFVRYSETEGNKLTFWQYQGPREDKKKSLHRFVLLNGIENCSENAYYAEMST
ncbi:hypothetical protein QQG55_0585 [Brugia pahangi]